MAAKNHKHCSNASSRKTITATTPVGVSLDSGLSQNYRRNTQLSRVYDTSSFFDPETNNCARFQNNNGLLIHRVRTAHRLGRSRTTRPCLRYKIAHIVLCRFWFFRSVLDGLRTVLFIRRRFRTPETRSQGESLVDIKRTERNAIEPNAAGKVTCANDASARWEGDRGREGVWMAGDVRVYGTLVDSVRRVSGGPYTETAISR